MIQWIGMTSGFGLILFFDKVYPSYLPYLCFPFLGVIIFGVIHSAFPSKNKIIQALLLFLSFGYAYTACMFPLKFPDFKLVSILFVLPVFFAQLVIYKRKNAKPF